MKDFYTFPKQDGSSVYVHWTKVKYYSPERYLTPKDAEEFVLLRDYLLEKEFGRNEEI